MINVSSSSFIEG